ncbi:MULTISPECIES: hypothetical protein [Bifidobacterium]|nr:hypothetical protein [Bifidobacterium tibiigranuli]
MLNVSSERSDALGCPITMGAMAEQVSAAQYDTAKVGQSDDEHG